MKVAVIIAGVLLVWWLVSVVLAVGIGEAVRMADEAELGEREP